MTLAPGIYIAPVDTRVVVLDTIADRYRLIIGRKAAALIALASSLSVADTGALGALVEDGILMTPANAPIKMTPELEQRDSALEMPSRQGATFSVRATGRALANVMLRERFGGLSSILRWASRLAPATPITGPAADVVALAQSYDLVRTRLPAERICLRDALTLYALLSRRGLDCALVFGVRLDPFGAHCWVQSQDIVLSDTLWSTRAMQPILVL